MAKARTKREKIKVENVVVSCDTHTKFALETLAAKLPDAEYSPESFPGLVYKAEKPKSRMLVFSTGKIISTGAKSFEQAKDAIRTALAVFRKSGIKVSRKLDAKVVNIVASADLGTALELNAIVFGLDNCEYEPEQFPGVVHRLDKPKVVFLLFSSGRIVVTGGKSLEEVRRGIRKLREELRAAKIIK